MDLRGKFFISAAAVIALLLFTGIALGIAYAVKKPTQNHMRSTQLTHRHFENNIPLTIWTYWNADELPELIQACVASWKRHLPEFKVIVLTPSNLKHYTSLEPRKLSWCDRPARESDMIRLDILARHGGVWSDASIYITQPYPFLPLIKSSTKEFIGFHIWDAKPHPVIESWWFACAKNSKIMRLWRDAFFDVQTTVEARLHQLKTKHKVNFENVRLPHYLYIHVAMQYVMQKLLPRNYMEQHSVLYRAADIAYEYLKDGKWNSKVAITNVLDNDCANLQHYSMLKFRSKERPFILAHHNWRKCLG